MFLHRQIAFATFLDGFAVVSGAYVIDAAIRGRVEAPGKEVTQLTLVARLGTDPHKPSIPTSWAAGL